MEKTDLFVFLDFSYFFHKLVSYIFCTKRKCRISTFQKCMGLCVFDVYEKYYNSKTGGMSNIMGKNPYPLSPQGVKMSKDGTVIRRFDFALILRPLTHSLKFRNLRIPRF